ncbi:MAG: NAD(P)/FAD-dependent oxidoreductase, partial [Candidatus Heimdallarchaeaceae archaeon]
EQVAQEPKIKTFTSYEIQEYIVGEKKKLEGVKFFDRANNKQVTLNPDGVFLLVGLKPNTEIAEGVVEQDQRGFIKTDEKMMSNIPGLFAIGDCRSQSTQQVAAAVGEGAIVVPKIRELLKKH